MGFYFWKDHSDFSVTNHVKLLGEGIVVDNERKLNDLWNELSMKPFEVGRSPWEVILVPDFHGENGDLGSGTSRWTFFFRWHHSLADGFSVVSLMSTVAKFEVGSVPAATKGSEGGCPCISNCFRSLKFLMDGPWVALELLCQRKDGNRWHLPRNKLTRYWHLGVGKNYPIQIIHDIRIGLNVSFTAVLLGAVAGSLRKFMVTDEGDRDKIPGSITCGLPFPVRSRPDKLRNNWVIATISLPIKEENPFKRLQIIERHLKELKGSGKPAVSRIMAKWLGSLPGCVIKALAKNDVTTVICSIMPGPSEKPKNFEGQALLDAGYITGLGPGRNGFSFSVFSYSEMVKFSVTMDSAFAPTESTAGRFILGIDEELAFLKQSCMKMITVQA